MSLRTSRFYGRTDVARAIGEAAQPDATLPGAMTAPIRHGAWGLLVGAAVLLSVAGSARAAGVADGRITTTYVMNGRIVTAVRGVRGEHQGQSVTRRWTFTGVGCSRSTCRRLRLRRQRGANRFDRLTLARVGVGSHVGSGRFSAALRCRGRRYPHGLVVPYTIRVDVAQVVPIEGIAFASQLTASYRNRRRIDRTRCPIGPSHDAAQYVGVASPPLLRHRRPLFLVSAHPADDSATLTDTSARGAGGAPIVSRVWQFGDAASGAADTATANPASHTFSAPGVYDVTLTVTDANGLSATATQPVTAPGPPTAAFTNARAWARRGRSPSRTHRSRGSAAPR